MSIEIYFNRNRVSPDVLYTHLNETLDPKLLRIEYDKTETASSKRTDPTIIVAVIGALSLAAGALISGLFQVVNQLSLREIHLELENGTKMVIKGDVTNEELDHYINRIKQLEENITIIELK